MAPGVNASVRRLMLHVGDAVRALYYCWQALLFVGALLPAPLVSVVGVLMGEISAGSPALALSEETRIRDSVYRYTLACRRLLQLSRAICDRYRTGLGLKRCQQAIIE